MVHPMFSNQFSGKSVLVTGGCGFIGSHLVEALVASDAEVTVLDNLRAGSVKNFEAVAHQIRVVEGDVRDSRTVELVIESTQPEFVFHLAANASVPASVEEP